MNKRGRVDKLYEVGSVLVSWGLKGGPELRSRRLLAGLREAHLEASLGQSVEG